MAITGGSFYQDYLQKKQQQSTQPQAKSYSLYDGAMAMQQPKAVEQPQATQAAVNQGGLVPVRSTLNSYGINNVGWNNNSGAVNLGNYSWTPQKVENGVSYDTPENIQKAALSTGKYVTATDYAANNPTASNIRYDSQTNTLSVSGVPVNVAWTTSDGKAVVRTADLEAAMARSQEASGQQDPNDILRKYQQNRDPQYEEMLDRIMNRNYDITGTPLWQSYQDQYLREGNRAMEDSMAQMAAQTGGFTSSAALTAGAQQRNYYNSQLMDRYPELYQMNYNMDIDALNALMNVDNYQFNREYGVNNDIYNRIANQNALVTEQDRYNWERNWADKINQQNLEAGAYNLASAKVDSEARQKIVDLEIARLEQQLQNGDISTQEAMERLAQLKAQGEYLRPQLGYQTEAMRLANENAQISNQYAPAIYNKQLSSGSSGSGSSDRSKALDKYYDRINQIYHTDNSGAIEFDPDEASLYINQLQRGGMITAAEAREMRLYYGIGI